MMEYTAVVKREGDWWVGWIEEIPALLRPSSSE